MAINILCNAVIHLTNPKCWIFKFFFKFFAIVHIINNTVINIFVHQSLSTDYFPGIAF